MDTHTQAFSVKIETQLKETTLTQIILFASLKSALKYVETTEAASLRSSQNKAFKLEHHLLDGDRPYYYGIGFNINTDELVTIAVAAEKIYE